MNQQNFLNWFENQLLKNLEEPSVIIMDNASYHSTLTHIVPNATWNKPSIQEWLRDHHVNFEDTLVKYNYWS